MLNESIEVFNKVIKRVFFLPEEKIPEAVAISRSEISPEIINLGKAPILVSNLEGKNYLVELCIIAKTTYCTINQLQKST